MIDSVNNNRGYYEYNKINTRTGTGMDSQEKFALGYDSTDKDSASKDDKKAVKDADGVVVEFSNQARANQGGMGSSTQGAAGTSDGFDMEQTIETAKGFVGSLIKAVSDFFSNFRQAVVQFWNSDSEKEAQVVQSEENEDITAGIIEAVGEESVYEPEQAPEGVVEAEGFIEHEADLPQAARVARMPDAVNISGKLQEAEELFASTHYAKNSDLLTYYDRRGKYVQLSGTDKNRILHGDGKGGRLI